MTNAFTDLGLSAEIAQALSDLGFEEPTPIQKVAIPKLLEGVDVLGQAATGTGKTAAFSLPLIERFVVNHKAGAPLVMVLTPTRELCLQVCESFMNFGKNVGIEVAPIYGGQEYGRQIRLLKRGVHVVVATPGRALDHLNRGTLDLSRISALVLDEADEMLDMGFADELDAILSQMPTERQTALFSATLPERIEAIAKRHLNHPEHIVIQRDPTESNAPRVPQVAYVVGRMHRMAALGRILDVQSPELAICFTRTRLEVDEVTEAMRARGFATEALHGGLDQASRDRVMKRAKNGQCDLVVATDVAARGIDLENVTHVINIGIPASLETYVHRIGRTGRAGRTGMAITLVEPREYRRIRALESVTRAKVDVQSVPSIMDVQAKRMELTRAGIREELLAQNFERYRVVVEQLCEEFDPFDVAAAAVAMCDKLSGGEDDMEEIPTITTFDRKPRPRRESQPPEEGMTRIFIGAGRDMGVRPGDLVGAITNEAGIKSRRIGAIDIAERFSLVEVDTPIAQVVIDALRGTTIKGRNVTVRRDRPMGEDNERGGDRNERFEHGERSERRERRPRRSEDGQRRERRSDRFSDRQSAPRRSRFDDQSENSHE